MRVSKISQTAALILVLAVGGCTTTRLEKSAENFVFTRTSVFQGVKIQGLSAGPDQITLIGYESDGGSEAVRILAEAAR